MAAPVAIMDFSKLYVSKSEMRLLRDICDTPKKRRAEDRSEEAERLAYLGLIELYENRSTGRQGLFATEMGRAYLEYADRARRRRILALLKWLLPLILAIAALALAIRANSLMGWSAGRTVNGTSGQSYQQRSTNTSSPTATSNPQNASAEPQGGASASSESSQTPAASPSQAQQPGNASSEPSGEEPDETPDPAE